MKYILFLFVVVMSFACKGRKPPQVNSDHNREMFLAGKRLTCIDTVIQASPSGRYGVFLFTEQDCGTCVNAGFYISKKLDSMSKKRIIFVVSSMPNPAFYQTQNSYFEYVYLDQKQQIRRELKYIPTPVLLLVEGHTIIDAFFPHDTLSYHGFAKKFIEN